MPFDPTPYAAGIRAANMVEAQAIRERAERALGEARRLAGEVAAADPSVERITLFGSLAKGQLATLHFDIDLAIEGGDPYRAMEIAETSEFDVDIVTFPRLPEHVQRSIRQHGLVLYPD